MTDWQPTPGETVAMAVEIHSVFSANPGGKPTSWQLVDRGDIVSGNNIAPWHSADELAAMEAVVAAVREWWFDGVDGAGIAAALDELDALRGEGAG